MPDINIDTVELRFKQAQLSHEGMARYTSHAISDMAWIIREYRAILEENKELRQTLQALYTEAVRG